MTNFSEMYRVADQTVAVIMIMAVLIVFVAVYPYFDKYRRTENYKLEQKQRHDRQVKRDAQKHERKMLQLKNKAKK